MTTMLKSCGSGRDRAVLTGALLLAGLLLATVGCGRERAAQAPPAAARTPAPAPPPVASTPRPADTAPVDNGAPAGGDRGPVTTADNGLTPSTDAAPFTSREAGFSAVFPGGCPRIRTRTFPGGPNAGPPEMVQCFCDLSGRAGEGVMVATYLTLRDERGGPPNPRNVTALIEELSRKFNLQVVRQATITRPEYEGVRVFCRENAGGREMWVQGMLAGDRVYIMTAWRPAGGGLSDAQIAAFFGSFRVAR
ncbi:MAG: hypothetical protein ACYDIE_11025 [Candidatus Krumholzibacteriia bacterium]